MTTLYRPDDASDAHPGALVADQAVEVAQFRDWMAAVLVRRVICRKCGHLLAQLGEQPGWGAYLVGWTKPNAARTAVLHVFRQWRLPGVGEQYLALFELPSADSLPAALPLWCPRHGERSVSRHDALRAVTSVRHVEAGALPAQPVRV